MSFIVDNPLFGSVSLRVPGSRNSIATPAGEYSGHVLVITVRRGSGQRRPSLGEILEVPERSRRELGRNGIYLPPDIRLRIVWVDEGMTNEPVPRPCYWLTASDTVATA